MDNTTFSNNLRLLIESHGLTVQDFSIECKIPHATLSRYLSGDREPKLSYVYRICQYFNVSVDWILGLSGEKFDVLTTDIQEVVSLYSIATPDDRRVIQAVLSKYKKE